MNTNRAGIIPNPADVYNEEYLQARRRNASSMYDRMSSAMADISGNQALASINKLNYGRQDADKDAWIQASKAADERTRWSTELAAKQREAEEGRRFTTSERLGAEGFQHGESELGRQFQTSEREAGQEFSAGQAELGRAFTRGERHETEQFQSEESRKRRLHEAEEAEFGRQFQHGESELGRQFQHTESGLGRQFQHSETELGRGFQKSEREAGQEFTRSENQLNRQQKADEFTENLKLQRDNYEERRHQFTEEMKLKLDQFGLEKSEADRLYNLNIQRMNNDYMLSSARLSLDEYAKRMDVVFREIGVKMDWDKLIQGQDQIARMARKDQYDYVLGCMQADNDNQQLKATAARLATHDVTANRQYEEQRRATADQIHAAKVTNIWTDILGGAASTLIAVLSHNYAGAAVSAMQTAHNVRTDMQPQQPAAAMAQVQGAARPS